MSLPNLCHDCHAKPGEMHQRGCDTERCSLCGGQAISCGCVYEVNGIDPDDLEEDYPSVYRDGPTKEMYKIFDAEIEKLGGRLPWTGVWPGEAECIEFGWYSKWVDGRGWVRCEATDEGAGPDLNRLHGGGAVWDAKARRWVLP